jgi:hypothetical protein
MTFTAVMLQTRQTAVFLHLLSSLVHSLRLLACLLALLFLDCLPLLHVVVSLAVPTSLRPFITFTPFPMLSSICSSFSRFLFSSFIQVRKGISRWTPQRVSVLDLHSTLSTSFPTTPVNYISFVQLLYRTSLHSAIGHRSVRSVRFCLF